MTTSVAITLIPCLFQHSSTVPFFLRIVSFLCFSSWYHAAWNKINRRRDTYLRGNIIAITLVMLVALHCSFLPFVFFVFRWLESRREKWLFHTVSLGGSDRWETRMKSKSQYIGAAVSLSPSRMFYSWKLHLLTVSRYGFFPDESAIFYRVLRIAISIYRYWLDFDYLPILLDFSFTRHLIL